jgi:ABC-type microcin C transport system permease subunit YejB
MMAEALATLIGITLIVFLITRIVPGGPIEQATHPGA